MKAKLLALSLFLLSGAVAEAHGENQLGPHGGYIRMPGAFHTEVTADGPEQIRVYLLDVNWENPSTKNSTVAATWVSEERSKASCRAEKDFFVCKFARPLDLKRGRIDVEATRENQSGARVSYPLPLRLQKH